MVKYYLWPTMVRTWVSCFKCPYEVLTLSCEELSLPLANWVFSLAFSPSFLVNFSLYELRWRRYNSADTGFFFTMTIHILTRSNTIDVIWPKRVRKKPRGENWAQNHPTNCKTPRKKWNHQTDPKNYLFKKIQTTDMGMINIRLSWMRHSIIYIDQWSL